MPLVNIAGTLAAVARDPDDNAVLECALTAPARFIITGDEDLLVLDTFEGVEILRAAGACVVGKPVNSKRNRSQRLCPGPRAVRR